MSRSARMRAYEFVADEPGDWALHCHKSHHTMNAMGHDVRTLIGVDKKRPRQADASKLVPDYMPMGSAGMAEMGEMEMPMPDNTLPMMTGFGQFGPIEMGGMFTVVKVREGLARRRLQGPRLVQAPARHGGLRMARARRPSHHPRAIAPAAPAGPSPTPRAVKPAHDPHKETAGGRHETDKPDLDVRCLAGAAGVAGKSRSCARRRHGQPMRQPTASPAIRRSRRGSSRSSFREDDGKMLFLPNNLKVRKGEQICLQLRNNGVLDHEFVVATVEENLKHMKEMEKNPDMEHDDPNAKRLKPKTTGEIVWQFTKAGTFDFSCLIPGHREAGMFGTIVVE